jgi:HAD superfamily hydrolase (TIGR01549 family)
MSSAVQAVFFDLDDTLCDSKTAFAVGLAAAFDHILAQRPTVTRAALREAWEAACAQLFAAVDGGGMPMAGMREQRFRLTLRTLDIRDNALADAADWRLGEAQLARLRLFDGALEMLDTLHEQLHVGIITNGAADTHPDSQRSKATHLGLLARVDSFLASDEAGARKPDRRIFARALELAGIAPTAALYVGDSLTNDIAGAKGAGMASVLFAPGNEKVKGTLTTLAPSARPWAVIRRLSEVVPLVASWGERAP